VNLEIRRENLDGLVTHYEKMTEKYQKLPYNRTLREAGREDNQKVVGKDGLSKKRGEAGMN
jgi:hypothetical protein